MSRNVFSGRKAVIATMHGKEAVIAPVLERELDLHCTVPVPYDTDRLGTFTGEVERPHDPLITARLKCLGAMDLTGCDIGIASEGSFGPAPGAFFLPCDEEWLILVDRKLQLEIVVVERSLHTNYSGAVIHSPEELQQFAAAAMFPEHGLIIRKSRTDFTPVFKGIHDPQQLQALFMQLSGAEGTCYVETDMRALHNPTRMQVISQAVIQLAARAATPCPACAVPGFGVPETVTGLPCRQCRLPTQLPLKQQLRCAGCGYLSEQHLPDHPIAADPADCNFCNP